MSQWNCGQISSKRCLTFFTLTFFCLAVACSAGFICLIHNVEFYIHPLQLLIPSSETIALLLASISLLLIVALGCICFSLITLNLSTMNIGTWIIGIILLGTVCTGSILDTYMYHNTPQTNKLIMESAIKLYKTNKDISAELDAMQTKLKCCGIFNYTDWKMVEDTDINGGNKTSWICQIPSSCLNITMEVPSDTQLVEYNQTLKETFSSDGNCSKETQQFPDKVFNNQGCLNLVTDHLYRAREQVLQITIAFLCMQIITIFLLSYGVKKSLRKRIAEILSERDSDNDEDSRTFEMYTLDPHGDL